jgi:hypothetical protein
MADRTSLYPSTGGCEVDLRDEFFRTLYGDGCEIPKGQKGFLRRMRKDENGRLIPCACVDSLTHEPDLDSLCPYCLGEGYFWDEELITFYKVIIGTGQGLANKIRKLIPGELNIPFVFWYVEYNVNPTKEDRLIEVELDLEGNVIIPVNRIGTYRLETVEAFRSDHGRVEYFRLGTNLEASKK